MKKVIFSLLTVGVVTFASCGGNNEADKDKMKQDSIARADSMARETMAEEARMQHTQDSINAAMADTTKGAATTTTTTTTPAGH